MKKTKGFTLIELLVVISIIALLLSILMPSLGKAKELARSVVCRSNLKAINLSAGLWSNDNDDWALGNGWSYPNPLSETFTRPNLTSLVSYSSSVRGQEDKNIYACPSAKSADFFGVDSGINGTYEADVAEKTITYGINGWISSAQPEGGPGAFVSNSALRGEFGEGPNHVYWWDHGVTKILKIRQPSDTVYFMDHEFYAMITANFNPLIAPNQVRTHYAPNGVQSRWHGRKSGEDYGYGNIAWVDGHVAKEPDNLDEKGGSLFAPPRWVDYFWDH